MIKYCASMGYNFWKYFCVELDPTYNRYEFKTPNEVCFRVDISRIDHEITNNKFFYYNKIIKELSNWEGDCFNEKQILKNEIRSIYENFYEYFKKENLL